MCNQVTSYKIHILSFSYPPSFKHPQASPKLGLLTMHTVCVESYRKVYYDEFVQNSLGCDMGMIIFDLHGYGGC